MYENRLRVFRADRRITQLDLGLKLKSSQNRISLIENGYIVPTPDEQKAFAQFFGVEPAEIFPPVTDTNDSEVIAS